MSNGQYNVFLIIVTPYFAELCFLLCTMLDMALCNIFNYLQSYNTCVNLVFGTIAFSTCLCMSVLIIFDKFLCENLMMCSFFGPGTVLVASQNLEDRTQISSITDQRCLPRKGDPLSALVSNANQQQHPECLLQRGKEELTTQPPHPISSFPQQGLSPVQERQNDSIVHISADPGKQVYQ